MPNIFERINSFLKLPDNTNSRQEQLPSLAGIIDKARDFIFDATDRSFELENPAREQKRQELDRIRNGIFRVENSGAIARGENVYGIIGNNGEDLGKYQVKPETLKEWSPFWLGREYSEDEFLSDFEAQEEFFNQFLAVVERLDLSELEAAIAWHRGWGELGTGEDREERDEKFLNALAGRMEEEISKRYIDLYLKAVR